MCDLVIGRFPLPTELQSIYLHEACNGLIVVRYLNPTLGEEGLGNLRQLVLPNRPPVAQLVNRALSFIPQEILGHTDSFVVEPVGEKIVIHPLERNRGRFGITLFERLRGEKVGNKAVFPIG